MSEITLSLDQSEVAHSARDVIAVRDADGRLIGTLYLAPESLPVVTAADLKLLSLRARSLPSDLSTLPTTQEVLSRLRERNGA